MDDPRPGSVRVNGGPWMPCRFVLDGSAPLVDWTVELTSEWRFGGSPDHVEVELAICPGVSVFGEVIVAEMHIRAGMVTMAAVAAGPLRGAR